jgi:formate-dependent nitrite reductase cytochrome c552 subunit
MREKTANNGHQQIEQYLKILVQQDQQMFTEIKQLREDMA